VEWKNAAMLNVPVPQASRAVPVAVHLAMARYGAVLSRPSGSGGPPPEGS
jgi:hypothetical protein